MALTEKYIEKVRVGSSASDDHVIAAKYLTAIDVASADSGYKTWKDILNLVNTAKVKFLICDSAANTPKGVKFTPKGGSTQITGTLEASAGDVTTFYLVYHPHTTTTGTTDAYDEYVVSGTGTSAAWEKIGNTDIDLSNVAKKGTYNTGAPSSNVTGSGGEQTASGTATVTYKKSADTTGSAGTHNHTVTAPTGTFVTGVKTSGGTANALTGVKSTGSETFVKSYPGATSYLKTINVTGVSGSATASKATAGTAITVAKKAATATTVGNANVGTEVTFDAVSSKSDVTSTNVASPTVVTIKQVDTVTAGTAATFTQGAKASLTYTARANVMCSPTVNSGILSWGLTTADDITAWTTNGSDSFTANKPTAVTTANVTGVVKSNATTPSATAVTATKVTTASKSIAPAVASETQIYAVGDTVNITPYTFEDVTVPKAASATAVVTGLTTTAATGMGVLTGLGTASTGTAITGVAGDGTATVILSTGLATSSAVTSVTLAEAGAHTHDITLTDASATGSASVAVSNHTHSLSNHTHSVTIPGLN